MPTYVNPNKCDGCKALDRPACQYICPSDIMHLDKAIGKAFNIEPDLCWECYSCVKTCPQGAIAMRGYGDVMPMGASLTPLRATDSIMWTVRFRDGQTKRFSDPIRTTPWGSIEPHSGFAGADLAQLKTPGLCGNDKFLGIAALPMLARV